MKTNQNLTRKMGDFEVIQRTKDGMFNATELLKQWNANSKSERKLDNFFKLNGTEDFVNTIIERENLNTPKLVYLKTRGKYNGGTWMHPLLFIDFAMWINSEFKYDVLKFIYDELIKLRNEAGDTYIEMSHQISKLVRKEFLSGAIQNVSRANNIIVYGRHERDIRNKQAEEGFMNELTSQQKKITMLIEEGFISNFEDLMKYLRTQWSKKYTPKELV